MKNILLYIAVLLTPFFLTSCNLGAAYNVGW
jgi:hypothetical protein